MPSLLVLILFLALLPGVNMVLLCPCAHSQMAGNWFLAQHGQMELLSLAVLGLLLRRAPP